MRPRPTPSPLRPASAPTPLPRRLSTRDFLRLPPPLPLPATARPCAAPGCTPFYLAPPQPQPYHPQPPAGYFAAPPPPPPPPQHRRMRSSSQAPAPYVYPQSGYGGQPVYPNTKATSPVYAQPPPVQMFKPSPVYA
ncbi:hypothetical protein C8R44DRAFT_864649 [Mycena epipterygia]|nr:hypothetical protein C8R44DRAFT_864649 [Mycena epipterygia]